MKEIPMSNGPSEQAFCPSCSTPINIEALYSWVISSLWADGNVVIECPHCARRIRINLHPFYSTEIIQVRQ